MDTSEPNYRRVFELCIRSFDLNCVTSVVRVPQTILQMLIGKVLARARVLSAISGWTEKHRSSVTVVYIAMPSGEEGVLQAYRRGNSAEMLNIEMKLKTKIV